MEVKEDYRLTEIGVIPEDWEVKKLGEIARVTSGGTPSTTVPEYWDGGIPWVTTGEVNFGAIYFTENTISHLGLQNSATKLLPINTILMAMYGQGLTRGRVALLGIEATINQACAAIIIDTSHYFKYIYYFLESAYLAIRELGHGGNQVNLNGALVKGINIPLPPLHEQRAIADALSEVDEAIRALDEQIAKQRDLKQGAMQELLTGRTRLPGFTQNPGYKETEVGTIPEDWKVDCIRNVAEITTGSRNTQDNVEDGEYPFFVRSANVERINSYSFDGEAVLTAGDGVGTGKIFHYINGKFDFHQRVYKISDFSSHIDGYFFYLYFGTHFYDRIMSMTAKSSVDSVRMEMIADMKIPLPYAQEQKAIATILSDMDDEIAALEAEREKTVALKQGMMQELLTGKTRLV